MSSTSLNYDTSVAFFSFVGISLSASYFLSCKAVRDLSKVPTILSNGDKTVLRLLEGERDGMIHAPSVSSITYFSGKVDRNMVKQKVLNILECNPWLLSRLVKLRACGPETIAVYPTCFHRNDANSSCNLNSVFQFIECADFGFGSLSYGALDSLTAPYVVAKGTRSINREESQFKVTLVEISKNEEYALIVSLSHVLGDGQTFYHIYSMLDMNATAKPLIAIRDHTFMARLDGAMGTRMNNWLTSPVFVFGILNTLIFGRKPKPVVYRINHSEVERIKMTHSDSLFTEAETSTTTDSTSKAYISTNDIITSWFLRTCKSTFGLMAINFRDRFVELTKNHGGNYESVLLYTASDYSQPSDIRRSVNCLKSNSGNVPSVLETLVSNCGVVTNWSSFYCDLHLGVKSRQVMHMPLFPLGDALFRDSCVIFNMNKDELALLMCCRSVDFDRLVSTERNEREFESGPDVSLLGPKVK